MNKNPFRIIEGTKTSSSEVAQTLNGWYALHDFRTLDWKAWKKISEEEREHATKEFLQFLDTLSAEVGSSACYSILGQKADLMLIALRETPEELSEVETKFVKLAIANYMVPSYSYVSVVELSNYLAQDTEENPYDKPYVKSRIYPELPQSKYVCFYPMDKRRKGSDNWYMLTMDERRELMYSHGMIGRNYSGKIKQIITGSVGLDDHEWGVSLFSDDMLQFKKIVYEMRFDEVSARYGEFGTFFVGNRLDQEKVKGLLSTRQLARVK